MAKVRSIAVRGLMLALCFVSVEGCTDGDSAGDAVMTRVDPEANFTAFKTFAFSAQAPNPDGGATAIPGTVSEGLTDVDDAVRSELIDRGLREVTVGESPDLFVVSLASTDEEQALSWQCVPGYWWGYWWGYSAWSWDPCAWLDPLYVEYQVGTVGVGLVHVDSQNVPFGGVIQGVLDGRGDVEERIQEDVERMFEDYPAMQTGSAP